MACGVALKRSLDFDPLHNSSPSPPSSKTRPLSSKRRKFSFSQRCGAPPHEHDDSSSSPSVWKRYGTTDMSSKPTVTSQSPFTSASPKAAFSSEEIVKHIYQEYRRIKRRRQIHAPLSPTSVGSASSSGGMHVDSFGTDAITLDPASSTSVLMEGKKNADAPLLSMKQVGLLCERLLKEQEDRLRSEYDKVLINKLTDQYDAFVKFSHDQLRRQITNQPASYVS